MRKQKTGQLFQAAFFTFCLIASCYAQSSSNGSICIAAVDVPDGDEKSLANPSGGNKIQNYEVQVDDKPRIKVSNTESVKIGGLAISKKHSIKIYGDGKAVESFKFSFSDYSSGNLCLWFKSLYETWSLWEAKDAKMMCKCNKK